MEWKIDKDCVDYQMSLMFMQERVKQVINGSGDELVWMLQYEALYTGGTSADPQDLLNSDLFPVFNVGRGGKYTYHGPGQRVIYPILNLRSRNICDLHKYIYLLEEVVIVTLDNFGINGCRKEGHIGVWVGTGCQPPKKIAAIGVRVSKWVSYHGIAVNLYPDLSHYDAIIPCGIKNFGVTSAKEMGIEIRSFNAFDRYFKKSFVKIFGE
ncbi:lipoate-protein ligase B [Neorickettsia sennetsu str. Miyayama]|uniref:Octanoyltransferase n=2 Tax=Ehrlichia sennetsu TaxID=951 RepID=LIPB_EHRS3|nr:RecName: Full=Octanoyltransferase; AltName: Full=Lipoate-protein ligase B; AltName: Full=Lipoyl/octanoyl transferase; AltName: Full=Octanoyl-[acyl-carrier-protein]-protein N-octanoyltransferase [Neorickettsia sennetsu str. Miyayama]ABD45710.1 lipoate-protein ligase B [Neorickettsia sennetsu str. Miyayama]